MLPSTLRRQLSDVLVSFAWDEWAQMGVLAAPRRTSHWAQDPEALIVFTLEVARDDPRLFDEVLDWLVVNEGLLSVRRLRALCLDDEDRRLVDAALRWTSRHRPRARLQIPSAGTPPPLTGLFHVGGPVRTPDEDFTASGWSRPVLTPSRKSRAPDVTTPINLAFRLREILGVGVRAEVVRVLLTVAAPWMTAQALARSTGYAKRNVQEALGGLTDARVASAVRVGSEQRYTAERVAWAGLLYGGPDEFPAHRDWPQLLGTLRQLLRWLGRPELEALSDYLRASQARDLLERLRPAFAFAGIPVAFGGPPETVWRDLEELADRALAALGVPPLVSGPHAEEGNPAARPPR